MYVEKIFSEIDDQDDRLYSVILDETEYALFSEFQKEFGFWGGISKAISGTRNAVSKAGQAVSNSGVVRKAKIAAAGHGGMVDKMAAQARQAKVDKVVGKVQNGAGKLENAFDKGIAKVSAGADRLVQGGRDAANKVATASRDAYQAGRDAARQAGRNVQAAQIHAKRGMSDRLLGWANRLRQ